jgi:hypothetical protein
MISARKAPDPPKEPQSIEKGQTEDQVVAAFGKPDKIVNLGSKKLYIYKDMKITFVGGKVAITALLVVPFTTLFASWCLLIDATTSA